MPSPRLKHIELYCFVKKFEIIFCWENQPQKYLPQQLDQTHDTEQTEEIDGNDVGAGAQFS
jgi:hypothetical protein